MVGPLSSLVKEDDGCIGPSGKPMWFRTNPQNYAAYAYKLIRC